jgi:hypothetical protein
MEERHHKFEWEDYGIHLIYKEENGIFYEETVRILNFEDATYMSFPYTLDHGVYIDVPEELIEIVNEWTSNILKPIHVKREETINKLLSDK